MKAIIIATRIAAWIAFTWILAKAAGMASREEEKEKEWSDSDKAHKDDR